MKVSAILRLKIRKLIDSFYCKSISKKVEYGKECSWFIDMSYLGPDSIVYSGGVGNDVSFEVDLIKNFGCDVFLFDPSDTGKRTINKLDYTKKIRFWEVGLDREDGVVKFQKPKDFLEGSYTIVQSENEDICEFPVRSISSIVKEFNHKYIDLLKLDIEGFEYGVLEDIFNHDIKVYQICVEFHHFFNEIPQKRTNDMIRQLKHYGYTMIHKRRLDYTFIKYDSIGKK
jgi:FkbM family methyltransferase